MANYPNPSVEQSPADFGLSEKTDWSLIEHLPRPPKDLARDPDETADDTTQERQPDETEEQGEQ